MTKSKLFLVAIFFINCSNNNPVRSAKTLPKNASYHNFGIELKPLEAQWSTIDSIGDKQSDVIAKFTPTATYSFRMGLFDMMEMEIGLGAGMIFGGASAFLKFPLTNGSNGYASPFKKQMSKFGSSLGLGGKFSSDFSSIDGWGEYETIGAYYFSYDLVQSFERKITFTMYSGIEGYFGAEGIAKLQENRSDYYSVSWKKTGAKIPFGVSFSVKNLVAMAGSRIHFPIYYDKKVFDGDTELIDGKIDGINSFYGLIFNISYSFDVSKEN